MDISVYFNDSASTDEIIQLQRSLASRDDVTEVKYISKDEALAKWLATVENERLKKIITERDNPLPRSLEVKLKSADYAQRVVDFLSKEEYAKDISKVRYNRIVIEKIITYSKAVKKVGVILSLIFGLVAVYVVLNTIRLAIYARRDEIEIMKLVGASPNYVVMPFIVEGIAFGVLGAFVSFLFCLIGVKYGLNIIVPKEVLSEITTFVQFSEFSLAKIFLLQIGLGVLVGIVCSLIGVRRYLK